MFLLLVFSPLLLFFSFFPSIFTAATSSYSFSFFFVFFILFFAFLFLLFLVDVVDSVFIVVIVAVVTFADVAAVVFVHVRIAVVAVTHDVSLLDDVSVTSNTLMALLILLDLCMAYFFSSPFSVFLPIAKTKS